MFVKQFRCGSTDIVVTFTEEIVQIFTLLSEVKLKRKLILKIFHRTSRYEKIKK